MTAPFVGPERPWERRDWSPSGAAAPSGSIGPWSSPGWRPSGFTATPSESLRVASGADQDATRARKLTVTDVMRLGAAGVIPGWSDEILGRLKSLKPSLTYEEAVAQERSGLDRAREKDLSFFVELGSGLLAGGAIAAPVRGAGLVARGVRAVQRPLQAVTGLTKGMPQTAAAAAAQGIRTGLPVGVLAGAGAGTSPDPTLGERAFGGITGGVIGGAAGGLFGVGAQQAMSRIGRPKLAPDDIRAVFGADNRDARRAVNEMAETARRADRTGADMRAVADAAPETPLFPADQLGDAGRVHLRQVDQLAAGTPISEDIGTILAGRTAQTPARVARGIPAATGRTTVAPAHLKRTIQEEKTALDNVLFGRAREAATERGPIAITSLDFKEALMQPRVQRAVKDIRESMDALRVGKKAKGVTFVDPYARNAKGRVTGVKNTFDPATLDMLARRLGEISDDLSGKTGNAANRALGGGIGGLKQQIRDELDVIPEFADANRLSARMNDRLRALDAGYRRGVTTDDLQMADEVAPWAAQAPLPLPADVSAEVSAALGRPLTALPSAVDDYAAGVQARRVIQSRKASPQAAANLAGKQEDLDRLAFGPGAQESLARIGRQEQGALRTAAASPSARGLLNAPASREGLQNAQALGNLGRHGALAAWNPQLGSAMAGMDIIKLGLLRAAKPGIGQLGAEKAALLAAPGSPAQDALRRLIDQTRQSLDTPLRGGLFNAGLYGVSGTATP